MDSNFSSMGSADFNAPRSRPPSKLIYFIPLMLLFAGIGAPLYVAFRAMTGADHQSLQLMAPGRIEYTMPEAGKLVILLETKTTYNGQAYFAGGVPAGTSFSVIEKASGKPLTVTMTGSYSESIGGTSRIGVAKCDVPAAGTYVVSVTGPMQPHVFLVRRSIIEAYGGKFAIAAGIFLTCLVVSISFFAALARRSARARQNAAIPQVPSKI